MKVLFFSPHAGIWQHAFPEALVADAVGATGAEVVYITCGGTFASGCVTMTSQGVTDTSTAAQRAATCAKCRRARDHLRAGFRLAGYDLGSVLDATDEARIARLLDETSPSEAASLVVDDVSIGRTALYEFLIERKKLELVLDDEEWRVFRPRLANTLRSLIAAGKIIERESPDRIVAYNSLYSVNAAWRAIAAQREIPFYFVHGGLSLHRRLQHVVVGRDTTLDWWARAVAAWPAYRDVPCRGSELAQVTEHFLHLFRGTSAFAYSAARSRIGVDVRARFGVRDGQRLMVATMSSYDEYVAAAAVGGVPPAERMLFPTQVAWAQALIEWARSRPDVFVVLRVHPREFPNKREGRKSEHAVQLETALATLPANVRVNWPTDRLSIYDLAEQTDVFLNAWSTAGREMTLFGIPVVTYCPEALCYPADLNFVGTSRESYFAAIDAALAEGWSLERVRRGYRWCVLELVRGVADIGDAFDWDETPPSTPWSRIRNFAVAQVRHHYDLWRRPARLAEGPRLGRAIIDGNATMFGEPRRDVDEQQETMALRRELRRLVDAMYGETRAPAANSLGAKLVATLSADR
jgi:hypothetical protein